MQFYLSLFIVFNFVKFYVFSLPAHLSSLDIFDL